MESIVTVLPKAERLQSICEELSSCAYADYIRERKSFLDSLAFTSIKLYEQVVWGTVP